MKLYYLALLTFSLAPSGLSQTVLQTEHEKSVVQIYIQKPDGSRVPKGTGFFVSDDGLIATALHVYTAALQEIVETRGGSLAVGRASRATGKFSWAAIDLISIDPAHDVMLVKIKSLDSKIWNEVGGIHPLRLSQAKEISPESPTIIVGYFGADAFPIALDGRIAGATTINPQASVEIEELLVSSFITPGESGSPVLLSDGTVTGVVSAMVPVTVGFNSQPLHSGLARVVKVEHLQRLLDALKK